MIRIITDSLCDFTMDYAKENTSLPDSPDTKRVEEFVMDVNRRALDV